MSLSDYSHSLKYAYAKTFSNASVYNSSYHNRVSLRDIGVRQPVVHFELGNHDLRYGTGLGGGATMSSVSSVRKVSEELARKRLADVDEADENIVPFFGGGKWTYDRKSSSGSILSDSSRRSSSDDQRKKKSSDGSFTFDSFADFWKSDFEPRRASDASVVLTEDTDSFIIGDRVWVGGCKPGQIAYIGETQFAPGDWAGVVLDDAVGKNDGSVSNIRYFQCEPKKGVFSRLTRLTRYPMVDAGEPAITPPARSPLPPLESKKSNGSLTAAPAAPRKSLVLTPTASRNSITKPSSPDSALHPNVTIGDRVIVMSSQGSKAGVLRFLGATDFAPGEWCGVELDDPLGKNDGSVAGTRYFECRPKFGLFAPLHKVSKSPSSRRPSQANCQIHRGGGSAGIRRQGSKESIASMTSSVASAATSVRSGVRKVAARTPTTPTSTKNALEDLLREKELHIEQLLKERDLERAEVTRAASQADEAERKLSVARQEYEQEREQEQARVADAEAMVHTLQRERSELASLLEDEKRRLEDLQFRFEEETIDKGDLTSTKRKLEDKVKQLEQSLSDERKRVELLEHDSNKLFETEEQLMVVKEEADVLKEANNKQKEVTATLQQEHIKMQAQLTASRAEIESLKCEIDSTKSSAADDENQTRGQLKQATQLLEAMKTELSKNKEEKESSEIHIKSKFEESRKTHELEVNKLTEKHAKEITELNKKLEELKNLSETMTKSAESEVASKSNRIKSLEDLLQKHNAQIQTEQEKRREIEDKLQKELKEYCAELKYKNEQLGSEKAASDDGKRQMERMRAEIGSLQKELAAASQSSDKQVASMGDIVNKLKLELRAEQERLAAKEAEHRDLKRTHEEATDKLAAQAAEIANVSSLKDTQSHKHTEEVERMKREFEEKSTKMKVNYEKQDKELNGKVQALELDLLRSKQEADEHQRETEKLKTLIEMKDADLKKELAGVQNLSVKMKRSEDQLNKMSQEKSELELKVGDFERQLQAAGEKLTLVVGQKEKLENDIASFISSSNDSTLQLGNLNADLRDKGKEIDLLRDENSKKSQSLERMEQEFKQTLEKLKQIESSKEESERKHAESRSEIEELTSKLESTIIGSKEIESSLQKRIANLINESELRIKEYEDKINAMQREGDHTKEAHDDNVNSLRAAHRKLEEQLSESEAAKTSLQTKLEALAADRKQLVAEMESAKAEYLTKEKRLTENFNEKIASLSNENEVLKTSVMAAESKMSKLGQELGAVKEEKNALNEEKMRLEKAVRSLEDAAKETQGSNNDLKSRLMNVENENKNLTSTVHQLREEKSYFDSEATEKTSVITQLKAQCEALQETKDRHDREHQMNVKALEDENEELKKKLIRVEHESEAQIQQQQNSIDALRKEISNSKQDSSQLASEKDTKIVDLSEKVAVLQKELKDNKCETERLSEIAQKNENKVLLVTGELEAERKKSAEYGRRLNVSDTERVDLKERYEQQSRIMQNYSILETQVTELTKKADEAKKKEEELTNNSKLERETLEKLLETTNTLLHQRESETRALSMEVETLKKEKVGLLSNKTVLETLQKEKKQLELTVSRLESTIAESKTNANIEVADPTQQLLEERDMNQSQVDFLNSVIVDMQHKNDALKARIEMLEMGLSPEDVDEFNLNNITPRSVAPRLFCDICDRFDLHDTEDCPTQAMDPEEPPPKSSKGKPPPERPYCDICEVFGHDTADCDDAETF